MNAPGWPSDAAEALAGPIESLWLTHATGRRWNERLLERLEQPLAALTSEGQAALSGFLSDVDAGAITPRLRRVCRCGSDRLEPLAAFDRFGLPLGSMLCMTCGLVQKSWDLSPAEQARYDERYRAELRDAGVVPSYRFLRALIDRWGARRIAYVGSNPQSLSRWLEEHELGATIDTGPDIASLSGTIDVIVVDRELEFLVKPDEAAEQLRNRLTSTGFVYVCCDGLLNLHRRSDLWFDYLRYRHHARESEFDLTGLSRLMVSNGFALIAGDESVEAAFRPGTMADFSIDGHAERIKGFLMTCEAERSRWTSQALERCAHAVEVRDLEEAAARANDETERMIMAMDRMKRSTSWRLTGPIRAVSAGAKKIIDI